MTAKDIRVRRITARRANATIRRHHYSGTVVRNSQIHLGVFYHERLEGAVQLGPPMDRSKLLPLVEGSTESSMLELNRMALSEVPPRNSESRTLAITSRLLRRHRPSVRWLVSFADATQCGDGTMYRAAGFLLTGIRLNRNLAELPTGKTIHKMTLESRPNSPRAELGGRSYFDITGGRYDFAEFISRIGGRVLVGYQLRYVKLLDTASVLTVPVLPYSKIAEVGAGMYRGERVGSIDSDAPTDPGGNEGGATPTPTLQ